MIIYFAYTQYHLFNCMNLRLSLHPTDSAIAFFMRPTDSRLNQFYARLIQYSVFDRIYDCAPDWLNESNALTKLASIRKVAISSRKSLEYIRSLTFDEKVSRIYTYGSSIEVYLLYDHVQRTNNSNVELVCYEEGAGSYCRPANNQLGRIAKTVVNKQLGVSMPDSFSKQLLYQPDCLGVQKICDVAPMPRFDRELTPIFNKVFGFTDEGDYSKGVFFNGPDRDLDLFLSRSIAGMNLAHTTTKSHPRATKDTLAANQRFLYDCPWEVLCANRPTNDKVFISHFSTALYTPKSIFGDEPNLVFLFELPEVASYDDAVISPVLFDYYTKFVNTYVHRERIAVPQSIDELKGILVKQGA